VTALLPHLSKLAIDNKREEVREQLVRAIRMVAVLTIPSGVAFLLFGPLITRVLFFGIAESDAIYIGNVLSALGIGLVAFSINIILIRGFNAFEDTRTQVLSILAINIVSVALSYLALNILSSKWVTVGLGIAFSISYILGLFVTLPLLTRHIGRIHFSDFLSQHTLLLASALVAMVPMFGVAQYFSWVNSSSNIVRVLQLVAVMLFSLMTYYFVARAMHIREIAVTRELVAHQLSRVIGTRRKPKAEAGE
jgi:putative peptidoglycan lipid II flippase